MREVLNLKIHWQKQGIYALAQHIALLRKIGTFTPPTMETAEAFLQKVYGTQLPTLDKKYTPETTTISLHDYYFQEEQNERRAYAIARRIFTKARDTIEKRSIEALLAENPKCLMSGISDVGEFDGLHAIQAIYAHETSQQLHYIYYGLPSTCLSPESALREWNAALEKRFGVPIRIYGDRPKKI